MSRDVEREFGELSHVIGYASLAAFIASDPEHRTAVYHRFDGLSARNLLYLQSELAELRMKQEKFDREDWITWKGEVKGIEAQKRASDWRVLKEEAGAGNTKAQERMQLISDIRSKLKEYREALVMESTMLSLQHPTKQAFDAFRDVFNNCDDSGKPYPVLIGQNSSLWDERKSLVALRRLAEEDRLTTALRKYLPYLFVTKKHPNRRINYLSEERIRKVVAFISMVLAAGLLYGAILNFYFVTGHKAKLGLIAAYTIAFALCVGLLTNAKRSEIFSACAAYAAVVVVFYFASGEIDDMGIFRGDTVKDYNLPGFRTMGVTAVPVKSPAQSVRDDIKSPETTSVSTLKLLRAVLGIDDTTNAGSGQQENKRHNQRNAAAKNPQRTPAVAKPPTSRSKPRVKVYEATQPQGLLLSLTDRSAVATEVFNTTLKTLSKAAKVKVDSRTPATPRPSPTRLKSLHEHVPLQETSPNRQTKLKQAKKSNGDLSLAVPPGQCLEVTAQCARVALECLYQLKDNQSSTETAEDLQLESGSLILVEKLHSLGYIHLAVKEIEILRDRLLKRFGRTTQGRGTSGSTRSNAVSLLETLWTAVDVNCLPNSKPFFDIVLKYQRSVMRICLSVGETAPLHISVDKLSKPLQCGPVEIAMHGLASAWIQKDQAVQHILAWRQALKPFFPAGNSGNVPSPSFAIPASSEFELHIFSLGLYSQCWSISPAKFDLNRHVWLPFRQIAKRFCIESSSSQAENYEIVSKALARLKKQISQSCCCNNPGNVAIPLPTSLNEFLADLAHDCGCTADAIRYLQEELLYLKDKDGATRTTIRYRIATLWLHDRHANPPACLETAEVALELLRSPSKGSMADLETLLLHGARLRKAAFAVCEQIEKAARMTVVTEVERELRACCSRIILAFASFLMRFLGHRPAAEDAQIKRFEQKLRLTQSITDATITQVIAVVKISFVTNVPSWEEAETALDCCVTLKQISTNQTGTAEPIPNQTAVTASVLVKTSNLYWSQYMKRKKEDAESTELLALLKRSTKLVSNRSCYEKEAALSAVKHERIAAILLDQQCLEEARLALRDAIAAHLESDYFISTTESKSPFSSRQLWNCSGPNFLSLEKLFLSHLKVSLKISSPKRLDLLFYDDERLSSAPRHAILERQCRHVIDLSPSAETKDLVSTLVQSVLQSYRHSNIDSQHLQFLILVARYAAKHNDSDVESVLKEHLADTKTLEASYHESQAQISPSVSESFLRAALRLQWMLVVAAPCIDSLNDFLDACSSIFLDRQTWSVVGDRLDDIGLVGSLLQLVIDHTGMRDLVQLNIRALKLKRFFHEFQEEHDYNALATCMIQSVLPHCRVGSSDEGGRLLVSAEKKAVKGGAAIVLVQYHLAHAEYLMMLANWDLAAEALEAAKLNHISSADSEQSTWLSRFKLGQDQCMCTASLLTSRWAFESGRLSEAILQAKWAVKLSSRIWSGFEKVARPQSQQQASDESDLCSSKLAEDMSAISVSKTNCCIPSLKGAAFWPFVQTHFSVLIHMSLLSEHCGLFQEAVFYAEQAQKVACVVNSQASTLKADVLLHTLMYKAERLDKSRPEFHTTRIKFESIDFSTDLIEMIVPLAEAYSRRGELDQATDWIRLLRGALLAIGSTSRVHTPQMGKEEEGLAEVMSKLSLNKVKAPAKAGQISKRKRPPTGKAPVQERTGRHFAATGISASPPITSATTERLHMRLDLIEIEISGEMNVQLTVKFRTAARQRSTALLARYELAQARTVIRIAKNALLTDPVSAIFEEASLVLPFLCNARLSNNEVPRRRPSPVSEMRLPKRKRGGKASREIPQLRPSPDEDPLEKNQNSDEIAQQQTQEQIIMSNTAPERAIRSAVETIFRITRSQPENSDPAFIRACALDLHQYLLFLAIVAGSEPHSTFEAAVGIMAPGSMMARRTGLFIEADQRLRRFIETDQRLQLFNEADQPLERLSKRHGSLKTSLSAWPEMEAQSPGFEREIPLVQQKVLEKLPESWNVVSINFDFKLEEILIVRLNSGELPFLLRLPICRSMLDESTKEKFKFQTVKDKLAKIVAKACTSAHQCPAGGDMQAQREWWNTREVLDRNLGKLLSDIEHIWLGGFRGVLAHTKPDVQHLASFSKSLSDILDSHLPSRKKSSKESKSAPQLHSHILSLFVNLGHPDHRDRAELDHCVTDLLNFVLDILYLQGERNAYDELDFESLSVPVIDALRRYHTSISGQAQPQHTVLILDNRLMGIPWESLPCLFGKSVSRVPSFNSLLGWLGEIWSQHPTQSALRIVKNSGTYILNPSGDLAGLETRLAGPLSTHLSTYKAIAGRAPTEPEFEAALRDNEVCLYFGHGSGSQYIRGKSIRQLKNCAVTLLMGCSSAEMKECGEYEPCGVPWAYLHAGCPAMVGQLWDVTDLDLDKFSLHTLVGWGLLPKGTEEAVGSKGTTKEDGHETKARPKNGRPSWMTATLSEAVAGARQHCRLRYLNGAAPVIYGVPVCFHS